MDTLHNALCSVSMQCMQVWLTFQAEGCEAELWGPEIIVSCLAPDLKDFPFKRALDNPRGTLLKPSSGGLGGHWRAGARAGELGGGDLNCAPPRLQKQDSLRADQRLGASLAVPYLRGNSHESTGAGKVQCSTTSNGQGRSCARSYGLGATNHCM